MAVSHPPAEEVADTLAKGSSDDGAESRYLDEFPPDTPRVAPAVLTPISDDFGSSWAHDHTSIVPDNPIQASSPSKHKQAIHGEDDDDVAPPAGLFESDAFQRIVVTISVLVAIYSAVMAALLAIFVPQHCCPKESIDDWGTCRNATTGEEDVSQILKICTIAENVDFENNTSYNNYVLVFNFITLASILAVFAIEYWRENFLITCLDIDKNKVDNHLKLHVFPKGKYPHLEQSLQWHNRVYFWAYVAVFVLWLCNALSSAVLVFRYYFLDTRTATVYITNNLLLLTRFVKGYGLFESGWEGQVASDSLRDNKGISFYAAKQVTFNAVDKDYKKKYLPGGKKYVPPPSSHQVEQAASQGATA